MRDATKEEYESVNNYIDSISKPTDINFFNLEEEMTDVIKSTNDYLPKDLLGIAEPGIEVFTSKIESKPAIAKFTINNVTVEVCDKKSIPNKFRRFMQKILLGLEWEIY